MLMLIVIYVTLQDDGQLFTKMITIIDCCINITDIDVCLVV